MKNEINDMIEKHKNALNALNDELVDNVNELVNKISNTIKSGNKILLCGNGGSAADAQHFAGELVGRYKLERKGIPAVALTTDTSILTSVGNDYGFDEIFSRQVEGIGKNGDIIIGISTSGNSGNVIKALEKAKGMGITTVGLTGRDGGKMKAICDLNCNINADDVPRIQEIHILLIHIICELVEKAL